MRLLAPIHRLKRKAKLTARQKNIPLNQALDAVAKSQGFRSWSLLVAKRETASDAEKLAQNLEPGDLVLLGGRPGHGKTGIGLAVAHAKMQGGFDSYFFTLEYHAKELASRFGDMGFDEREQSARMIIDTSDNICADHIVARMERAEAGTIAVIDYLQILDQRRSTPELDAQLKRLQDFARTRGITLILISQIDRAFEQSGKSFPDLSDVRQPNPIDLERFNQACFVHENRMRWDKVA